MFNFIKKKAIENRVQDEILFEYVLEEMESGIKIKGLHAKAIAYSDGNDSKAVSLYMKYRVQSIKDYFTTLKMTYEKMTKEEVYNYIRSIVNEEIYKEDKFYERSKIETELEEKTAIERDPEDEAAELRLKLINERKNRLS